MESADPVALLQEAALLCALYGDNYVDRELYLPKDKLTRHKSPVSKSDPDDEPNTDTA
jgi:hypothetical protein